MSHTALVNVDAAATSKLSSFIADLTGDNKGEFMAKCETNQSQTADLLQTLLSQTDLILALDNEKGNLLLHMMTYTWKHALGIFLCLLLLCFHFIIDAEGCFQAIVAILHSAVSDSSDEQRVITTLVDSLSANANGAVVVRIFVSVFNLLRSSSSKFHVLKGVCGGGAIPHDL
jgi:hypothetical protein